METGLEYLRDTRSPMPLALPRSNMTAFGRLLLLLPLCVVRVRVCVLLPSARVGGCWRWRRTGRSAAAACSWGPRAAWLAACIMRVQP